VSDRVYLNTSGIVAMLRSQMSSLSPREQVIAEYVLRSPETVIYQSVNDLAEASGSSETTIVRFCQNIGYKGYSDFKMALARDMVKLL